MRGDGLIYTSAQMNLVAAVIAGTLLACSIGCRHAGESASDRCWRALHGNEIGSAFAGKQRSEIADALERQRCTALEQEERAEARLSRAERRERKAREESE